MQKISVKGGKALKGTVEISGSKNATLPVMTAALLAESPSTIHNVPYLNDIKTMAEVLRKLGRHSALGRPPSPDRPRRVSTSLRLPMNW